MQQLVNVPLPAEGANRVTFPLDGEILAVTVGPGEAPTLAVFAERGGKSEFRDFHVARAGTDLPETAGDYVGFAQAPGRLALHVFAVEEPEGKGKKG
jgi:hypothetical protein